MNLFRTFFSLLSHEFKIPIQEIEKEWSAIEEGYTSYYPYDKVVIHLCGDNDKDDKDDNDKDDNDKEDNDKEDKDKDEKNIQIAIPVGKIDKKCIYEFVRSAKKGSICGERATSGDFCNKHKKYHKNITMGEMGGMGEIVTYENKNKKKKTSKKERTEEFEKYTQEPLHSHSDIKQPISIRLNYRINRYIHPDSGMTFFSKEEKVVFARFDKNQSRLVKLTEDDIVLCKMYSFRVDPNKWDIQNITENDGNEIQ